MNYLNTAVCSLLLPIIVLFYLVTRYRNLVVALINFLTENRQIHEISWWNKRFYNDQLYEPRWNATNQQNYPNNPSSNNERWTSWLKFVTKTTEGHLIIPGMLDTGHDTTIITLDISEKIKGRALHANGGQIRKCNARWEKYFTPPSNGVTLCSIF